MTQVNLNAFDFDADAIQRELEHEEAMKARGRAAAEARMAAEKGRGNGATTAGAKALISSIALELADRIVEEIARLESGNVKRKPPELRNLKLLPARDMAVLALRSATNALAQYDQRICTTQRVGFMVGNEIECEYLARLFRKDHRGLFDTIIRRLNERSKNPAQRRKELLEAYERVETDPAPRMAQTDKVRLGAYLLGLMEAMGIVESASLFKGKKATKVYEITAEALMIMAKTDAMSLEMQPHLYPTIIPPRPWEDIRSGGYWQPFKRSGTMVVARTKTNGIKRASEDDMPRMFGPVNYLQNTPWRVNKRVYEVARQMQAANITCSSMPPSALEPVPAKPHDIETNEESRTKWRRAAREVHTRNAQIKGRVLAAAKTMIAARDMLDEPTFYFPKVVDFRGRVYDAPSFLKPQGDDLSKGLLEFANAKEIGEEGMYWLAVHGANVWGEDKCSFDDREAWVRANEGRIRAIAEDPFADRMWMDADKPFAFLAFCFEWAGVMQEGAAYASRLPVAMDGSCNGLQHLSAMLRDEVGGAAVNLMPASKPQDIYTEVLNKVVAELERRSAEGEPTAQKWLPLMQRKTVKRPVMTLPYGATKTGFADQIMEDTLRPLQKAKECPFASPYEAAQYLGKIVWEATGEVVIAARAAMDWLQEVAKVVSDVGQPIEWTTPSGFRVKQDYRNVRSRKVELMCAGQRIQLHVADGHEDKLDKTKMAMAIAPNFVHAMDAAHMLRAVERMLEEVGPSVHLAMIHDSYATHAADTERLRFAIRQSFVEMYQERCWLTAFRDEVAEQIGPEAAAALPPVPATGLLEITDVLNSLYFFG